MEPDDPRQELRSLVAAVRTHLRWLKDGGVPGLPRGAEPAPIVHAAPARPPVSMPVPHSPAPAPPPDREDGDAAAAAQLFSMNWDQRRPGGPSPSRPAGTPPPPGAAPAPAHKQVYPDLPDPLPLGGQEGLDLVRGVLGDCQRCKLCHGRNSLVFGQGAPATPLCFVGEGPGAEEDRTGLPFVGAAGDLLTRMIAAMGFRRDQVYICNVVKCRPPGNRTPEPDEIAACAPFLHAQLHAIRPRVIVALGRTPTQFLLNTSAPVGRLRGRFSSWEGIPVMPTFHPAYLLRTPSAKRQVWEDLQLVMTELKKPS